MTTIVARIAERNVLPIAKTFVIVRFFGCSGLANARAPLTSAPMAGRSGTSRSNVFTAVPPLSVYAERSEASPEQQRSTGRIAAAAPEIPRCARDKLHAYPFKLLASSTLMVLFRRY